MFLQIFPIYDNIKMVYKIYRMNLGQKQKIIFLDNLWSLIESWIPVIQALDVMEAQAKNPKIKKLVDTIRYSVSEWEWFFKMAKKIPKLFNYFDLAMIETWEATWKIWRAFETIVQKEEKEYDLKKKVTQALIYPFAIIIITVMMITIIMTYVIPKIEKVYKDSNVNLPALTTAIINISHFILNYWIIIAIFIAAMISLYFYTYHNVDKFRIFIDKNLINIPIFWEIMRKRIIINFSDFLALLLESWIMINKALLIIKWAMDNSYYSLLIDQIWKDVKNWMLLSEWMWADLIAWKNLKSKWKDRIKAFPIELITAVKIWEQTWTLSKMLYKSSTRYTKEIDNLIKNLSTMLEPVIIVLIWWIVWTIIMAIMLPFLNIANVIK